MSSMYGNTNPQSVANNNEVPTVDQKPQKIKNDSNVEKSAENPKFCP